MSLLFTVTLILYDDVTSSLAYCPSPHTSLLDISSKSPLTPDVSSLAYDIPSLLDIPSLTPEISANPGCPLASLRHTSGIRAVPTLF